MRRIMLSRGLGGAASPGRARTLGLLGLVVGHWLLLNVLWILWDTAPPGWDPAIPLVKSLMLTDALAAGGFWGLLAAFPSVDGWHPPLLALLIVPAYLVVGVSADAALLINQVALVTMAAALYLLGAALASPTVGLVAVHVAATMPLLAGLSRQGYPEFPLAALVTIALCLMARSDDLRRRGMGLPLGLTLGAGLLVKTSFPIFVAGPLLVMAWRRLRARPAMRALAIDLLAVGLPAALVAATWYRENAISALRYGLSAGYGQVASLENFGPVWSPVTLGRFLHFFVAWGPSYYWTLALVGLLWLDARRGPARPQPSAAWPLIVAWVLGALLVFTTAVNKDIRYLAPLVPGLALLVADRLVWCWRAWPRPWRTVLLALPMLLLYVVSFAPWEHAVGTWQGVMHGLGGGFFTRPPRSVEWPAAMIVRALDRHAPAGEREPTPTLLVVMTTNHEAFHKDLFNFMSLALGRPYRFEPLPHYHPDATLDTMLDAVRRGVLVLGTTGPQGPAYATRFNAEIHDLLDRGALPFTRVPLDVRLPDGSSVRLYRRNASDV